MDSFHPGQASQERQGNVAAAGTAERTICTFDNTGINNRMNSRDSYSSTDNFEGIADYIRNNGKIRHQPKPHQDIVP